MKPSTLYFTGRLPLILVAAIVALIAAPVDAAGLNLLFMGDNGHHLPARRFQEIAPALKERGIHLKYTDRMADLNPKTLRQFDGLVLYANIDRIEDAQAKALLDYVASGKGFIPLHCATFCWRNNSEIVALMGAQFKRHGGQVFKTEIAAKPHPVIRGFGGFTSWDETYIHHLHNEKNRTVLEYRAEGVQAEGNRREPWTWVRTHGKGRVFYTAWGHDQRTFKQAGFHNLLERGIRWACGDDPAKAPAFVNNDRFDTPAMQALPQDAAKFEYVDVGPKIPNYTPGANWGKQGAPRNLMQKPLPAAESIKHFVTPEGMAVRRYADERNFQAKPIAMTWDERGRLWVCETVDYPNELGGNRDRIRICEDTDGDHVADKFTVFADGLSIPTAIVVFRGGAVVQNGTETIYLKDTDGDDVSDQKTTLISNWTLGDTHGGVSNFRYGLDNWIWAMQGYNKSTPVTGGKKGQSFGQGFWRFKLSQTDPPVVTDLEFVRSSNNNTWGLGISEEGLIFGSTANHNPSMFMTIPNRYYERVRGWAPATLQSIADNHLFKPITSKVRQVDHFGGYTAGAGHSLYTARAFPQQWWNKTAFVCGPTGHLVGTFVLRPDGANFKSTSPVNLLASDDEWSAPVMAETGPDGAVWVIDWYNYIVQHNPTPNGFKTGKGRAYESDLRDKKHGRIYRVVATADAGDSVHKISNLANASNTELVKRLKHPSFVWRLQTQRLLIERKALDVAPQLIAFVADSSVDQVGLNAAAIHALHTLAALGYFTVNDHQADSAAGEVLSKALAHPSAGVRRNALAVMPRDKAGLRLLLSKQRLFADANAQVRLQAILTLADMPVSPDAGSLIARLTVTTTDPVLTDALTSAAATHAVSYLASVASLEAGQVSRVTRKIAAQIAQHVSRSRPDAASLQKIVASLPDAEPQLSIAILDGLAGGLPRDFKAGNVDLLEETFASAFKRIHPQAKVKLLRLASRCGAGGLQEFAAAMVKELSAVVSNPQGDATARVTAARDLVSFQPEDDNVVQTISAQLTPQTPPSLAGKFLDAIRISQSKTAGGILVKAAPSFTPQTKVAAVGVLLSKPDWTASMLAAVEAKQFDLNQLSLQQKQVLRTLPDRALRAKAEKLLAQQGGVPDADREKVLQSLLHVTQQRGDVALGLEVFKKVCASCHKHGETGRKIGPDLTGMAVHPKAELLTHIIDPSRNVEGNYRLYNVVTADGEFITGMLSGETKTSVTLIDPQAKTINVPREDIEELIASRNSLMPEGFEKQLSEKQLVDLLEFLTQKGKYVPLPLDRYATAISTKGLFSNGDNGPDRMVFSSWKPKVFQGVPFVLTDPEGKSRPNVILLHGPNGPLPPKMPKSVRLACNTPAKAVHLLSGVGGWNYPYDRRKTVSMIVRLHYEGGMQEDHKLINGVHFADYIRRVDVPESKFAYQLGGQQVRYLKISPRKTAKIESVELIKGDDNSAPIVMAVTLEQ